MVMIPPAMAVVSGAPPEATVRAARALGGVAPWSTDETRRASMSLPISGVGNSPLSTRYTISPKEMRPINWSMG